MNEALLIILAVVSILASLFDAKSDAVRDNGKMNHFLEFMHVLFTLLSGVAIGLITAQGVNTKEVIWLLILSGLAFVLFRFGTFNPVYNASRKPKKYLIYVSKSDNASVFDRFLLIIPGKLRPMFYAFCIFLAFTCVAIIEYITYFGI